MSRTVTLSDLREAIRVRYDLPSAFSSTTFVTTSAVNSMINASLQAFYALLIECYGDNYFAASATLSTTANVGLSSLPSRCYKLLRLWYVRGTDDVRPIARATSDKLALAHYSAKDWSSCTPHFRLSGWGSIQWLPKPSAVYTVGCDHVSLPADLSADADAFNAGPGWEEWLVNDVCRKIAMREEKPPAEYQAERADWEARIRAQAPERDEGDGMQVRDVLGGGESDYARFDRLTYGDG